MGKYIIPYILNEDVVQYLSDEILELLVACTTSRVDKYILAYLESEGADKESRVIIENAYKHMHERDKFLNDDKTKEYCALLSEITYSTLSLRDSIEYLEAVKEAIDYVTQSKYAVPYIAPVHGNNLKSLKEALKKDVQAGVEGDAYLKSFLINLEKYGDIFRDPQSLGNQGTAVKKVIRNVETYEIIKRGVDFIINIKKTQRLSSSWRFL